MCECECVSVSVCQCVSVSVCQCVSVSVCQCVSVSVCVSVCVRVCECVGVVVWLCGCECECECVSLGHACLSVLVFAGLDEHAARWPLGLPRRAQRLLGRHEDVGHAFVLAQHREVAA